MKQATRQQRATAWDRVYYRIFVERKEQYNFEVQDRLRKKYMKSKSGATSEEVRQFIIEHIELEKEKIN